MRYPPCLRQVAHALLTRPPLGCFRASSSTSPLDLHVLGTPPAFVLSQDQTLALNPVLNLEVSFKLKTHSRIDCLCFDAASRPHLAFVFSILYRFQGSACQLQVALALTAQLVYYVIRRLSTPFSHFFAALSSFFLFLILPSSACHPRFSRSNVTEMDVPRPSSLSMAICAPCFAAMCLTMARPSPVPPVAFERLLST